jgi:hypothetical protein
LLQEEFEAVTRQVASVLGKKAHGKQGEDAISLYGGDIRAMHAQAEPPGSLVDEGQVCQMDSGENTDAIM